MVVQRTIDNLKDKPHEEKKVVAGGIAILVVMILLVGWGFIFLRKIQRAGDVPTFQGAGIPEDQLNAQFLSGTQEQLNQYYQSAQDQLREIREDSAAREVDPAGTPDDNGSGFGAQNNDF